MMVRFVDIDGKTKQKHNTICAGHYYTQTSTNNVNKICALLQTNKRRTEYTSNIQNLAFTLPEREHTLTVLES